MAQASRDENRVTTLLAVSSSDGTTPVAVYADPTTHRLLTSAAGGAAPSDAEYVTLAVNATLTNERVLTGTANQITITDNGAGSTVVLSLPQSIATSSTPTFASLTLTGASSLTLGTASTNTGAIILKNSTNANNTTIQAGAAGAALVFTLPTTDGNNGEFLQTDGNGVMSWAAAGGGTPGGADTQLQYNNAGSFGGITGATTNGTAVTLTSPLVTTKINPSSNDGATLGESGTAFSDLFLASGGVINFDAGDITITHSANTLTIAGGTLVFPSPFTLGATSVTTTGTQLNYLNAATGTTGTTSTNIVFSTSPTLVTPTLGVATATSVNKVAITAPATSATLTLADGSTLATSGANSITLTSTGATNITLPTTGTLATLAGAEELDNKTLDSSVGKGTWTASGTWTLPALTAGGTVTLAENSSIALDPAGSADGKYTGITITGTAGAALAFGDVIYLDPTDSRWELADANAAAAADGDARGTIGICVLAAAGDGSATTILLMGVVRADTAFPALTINAQVFVSETAGDLTQTKPTTTDAVVRCLGSALTADEILFLPSSDWYSAV